MNRLRLFLLIDSLIIGFQFSLPPAFDYKVDNQRKNQSQNNDIKDHEGRLVVFAQHASVVVG